MNTSNHLSSPPSLPAAFVSRMESQLGSEWVDFLAALARPSHKSIRLNPAKPAHEFTIKLGNPVPWCPSAYYVDVNTTFYNDPYWHAGVYYVQEASSMLIHAIVSRLQPQLALDLCAAPGGKTTLLASTLPGDAIILANEAIGTRIGPLKENTVRWGDARVMVSHNDPENFSSLHELFDLVLVDAPCSGEGLFRKHPDSRDEWSPAHVDLCAKRQKRILAQAVPLLAAEGTLIYTTCTYAPDENRDQIAWLLAEYPDWFQPVALPEEIVEAAQLVVEYVNGSYPVYQAYPHRLLGEGFFLAALQRTDCQSQPYQWPRQKRIQPAKVALPDYIETQSELLYLESGGTIVAVPAFCTDYYSLFQSNLRMVRSGINMGVAKARNWVPDHECALCPLFEFNKRIDLEIDLALDYLRGSTMDSLDLGDAPSGYYSTRYGNQTLGWLKYNPLRINNLYPKPFRLRK
jgi:16S rRNA C967 or C1407 C5-methylase (RsmB/RsmF family)/NOL1/NOP2/fmu family ribosome biogenesis protein